MDIAFANEIERIEARENMIRNADAYADYLEFLHEYEEFLSEIESLEDD